MIIYHKAYKKDVTVSALADARQLIDACSDTKTETDKLIKGSKALVYAGHKGIDAWSNWGSKIYATHGGIVSWVSDDGNAGGGCWLEVSRTGSYSAKHKGQDAEQYKHFRRGSIVVKQGQKVEEGQLLGIQGTTGNSTGEHLHYEVIRNGQRVDPLPYARGDKIGTMKVYNTNDLSLTMITAGGWVDLSTAQTVLEAILIAIPEVKPFAGIRMSPTSSAGKFQVVLCRFDGTLKELFATRDRFNAKMKSAGQTVPIESWGW